MIQNHFNIITSSITVIKENIYLSWEHISIIKTATTFPKNFKDFHEADKITSFSKLFTQKVKYYCKIKYCNLSSRSLNINIFCSNVLSPFIKDLFMQGLKIDPKRTWHLKKTIKFTSEISQRRFKTFFRLKMTLWVYCIWFWFVRLCFLCHAYKCKYGLFLGSKSFGKI